MRLPRLLAGGMLVAVVAGTAACGAQAMEPKLQLRDAARAWAAGPTGAVELSIASSAEEVRAFAAAADPGSGDDTDMSDDDLATVLSSSLEFGYDRGDDREDAGDDAARFALHVDNLDAGEFLAIGDLAYARADLAGLAEQFPRMEEGLDGLRAQLTGADVPPSMVEPATALFDGEWVFMDVQAYFDEVAGGPADTGLTDEAAAELRNLLGTALKDAVVSVQRREADDDLGDHLVAAVDLRKAYEQLRSGLPEIVEGAMADQLAESLPPVDEVPAKQIDVSFWVHDETLSRVELDLAQFLEEPAGHLLLRADVTPGGRIDAPSDAVELDVAAIDQEAAAIAQEAAAPVGGPAEMPPLSAYLVAEFVDEDLANLAYEWHTAPSVHLLPEVLPYYDDFPEGLEITAVGDRVQVTLDQETVCLRPSHYGNEEDIEDGPC